MSSSRQLNESMGFKKMIEQGDRVRWDEQVVPASPVMKGLRLQERQVVGQQLCFV